MLVVVMRMVLLKVLMMAIIIPQTWWLTLLQCKAYLQAEVAQQSRETLMV
jgi:hypothetical protein